MGERGDSLSRQLLLKLHSSTGSGSPALRLRISSLCLKQKPPIAILCNNKQAVLILMGERGDSLSRQLLLKLRSSTGSGSPALRLRISSLCLKQKPPIAILCNNKQAVLILMGERGDSNSQPSRSQRDTLTSWATPTIFIFIIMFRGQIPKYYLISALHFQVFYYFWQ